MIPHERSLVASMTGKAFALVGVNSESSLDEYHRLAAAERVVWPSFFDGGSTEGPIATRWGVRGWPTGYVLDKKGITRFVGPRDEEMTKAVEQLLAEDG